jgi:hypothetical protein
VLTTKEIPGIEPIAEPGHGGLREKWLSLIALLMVTASAVVLFYPK